MVIPMADDKLTMEQLEERKTQKTMRTVARRASYYRENPHRFAEVLGFHLKLFQKILIYAMMHYDFFMFIAARSTGKQKLPMCGIKRESPSINWITRSEGYTKCSQEQRIGSEKI